MEPMKLTINTIATKLQSEANHHTHKAAGGHTALYVQKRHPCKHHGKPNPWLTCRDNGHSGHTPDHCPHHYKNRHKAKATEDTKSHSANLATATLRNLGTQVIDQVYMATYDETMPDDIPLDNPVTCHMCWHHHSFTNYRPSTEDKTISVGNNHSLRFDRQGSIKIKC
jgi:hypothetical protein